MHLMSKKKHNRFCIACFTVLEEIITTALKISISKDKNSHLAKKMMIAARMAGNQPLLIVN